MAAAPAVENLVQYGLTRVTWKYWGRQLFTALGVLVTVTYLATLGILLTVGDVRFHPFWILLTLVFVVERAVTVRLRGWRQMLLGLTMYELVLDYFLQACHAKAYFDAFRRTRRDW